MNKKICGRCKLEKDLSEFYKSKRTKDRVRCYCKICEKNINQTEHYKELNKIRSKKYYTTKGYKDRTSRYNKLEYVKIRTKECNLIKNYGITLEQYNELLLQQNHKCAICGKDEIQLKRKLAVDHDHKTGKIRGLLCNNCNIGLGNLQENINILKKCISYLEII